jgi:hypothetical protein
MNVLRKIIAVFIILFMALPILIGVIFAAGFTRAAVSPEFFSELPKELITKLPGVMDEAILEINRGEFSADEDTRAWAKAIGNTQPSIRELVDRIGITNWMKTDFTQSMNELGMVLRGEKKAYNVKLNLRPLKEAFKHPELTAYLKNVLSKLPPCTAEQGEKWLKAYNDEFYTHNLPACQPPDIDKAIALIQAKMCDDTRCDMPDEANLFQVSDEPFFHRNPLNIAAFVKSLSFLLFLIPLFFLGLAALTATFSGPSILRWIGVPTLIGGAITFGLSRLALAIFNSGFNHYTFFYSEHFHSGWAEKEYVSRAFAEKVFGIISPFTDRLFLSVGKVSGIVCVVGIILIALSYAFAKQPKRGCTPGDKMTKTTTPTAPTPPTPPPAPIQPETPQEPAQ